MLLYLTCQVDANPSWQMLRSEFDDLLYIARDSSQIAILGVGVYHRRSVRRVASRPQQRGALLELPLLEPLRLWRKSDSPRFLPLSSELSCMLVGALSFRRRCQSG